MSTLTDAEKRKLWEGCGFKWVAERHYVYGFPGKWYDSYWLALDGEHYLHLPDIDLNNLFKYSPFPTMVLEKHHGIGGSTFYRANVDKTQRDTFFTDDHPADAVARAMLKAFEEKEEEKV